MHNKIPDDIKTQRAEILGAIAAQCAQKSLQAEIGSECEIVIDGESDEHELLLSARKLIWAPEIDGEIYVNDQSDDEQALEFAKIYKAKITELVGNVLTATAHNAAK
jgi:tRNA A37 methylthiotransferase MiaB